MYLRSNNSEHGPTGSPYYIGKGRGLRAFSSTRKITKRPSNSKNIIFIAENMNEPDAHQLEMLLIHVHGRIDIGTGCLRNLTDGGEGKRGNKQSPETIEKRAAKMRGRVMSEKTKLILYLANKGKKKPKGFGAKVSERQKGKKLPPERVAKIVAASIGRKHPPRSEECRIQMSLDRKGRKMPPRSDEHRAKLSAAQTGKVYPPERVARMVTSRTGKKVSKETKRKMSESAKGRPPGKHWESVIANLTGRKVSEETRTKMKASRLKFLSSR